MRSLIPPSHIVEASNKVLAAVVGLSLHDAEWALDVAGATLHRQQDATMQSVVFELAMVKPLALPETEV